MRPRVKICGVTEPAEAVLAADLGADLIGLNFHPPSPRYLTPTAAAEIVQTLASYAGRDEGSPPPKTVGVFVNLPIAEAENIAEQAGLDLLQFHGDETAEQIRPLADRSLKALRVSAKPDASELRRFADLGLWGLVVDSHHPSLYGGTGESWDFAALGDPELASDLTGIRLLMAGGLNPDNVAAAITAARPWGIDLCSGIEARPGEKDPQLMKRLFEEIDHVEITTPA